MILFPVI